VEQLARPDYEHCEVSVSHPSGWYIAATMPGLVTLGHQNGSPDRFLYGLSKEELVQLFLKLARGLFTEVLTFPWVETAGAFRGQRDHYLFANRTDMTELHRAAAKGDVNWAQAELANGADLTARDRDGATPLHRAALAGHLEMCRLLLVS
jgi:hypothetical protein